MAIAITVYSRHASILPSFWLVIIPIYILPYFSSL
jgi:hypothetical protein